MNQQQVGGRGGAGVDPCGENARWRANCVSVHVEKLSPDIRFAYCASPEASL